MPSDTPTPVCVYRFGHRTLIGAVAVVVAYLVLALVAPLVFADEHDVPRLTEAQVEAGAEVFAQSCAFCHGASLEGQGSFPVLAGEPFRTRWEGRPVGELFGFVSENMPLGAGGSLDPSTYASLVALILERNGAEPGDVPFDPTDEAALGVVLGFGE